MGDPLEFILSPFTALGGAVGGLLAPDVPALPAIPPVVGPDDAEVEAARRALLAQFAAQGPGASLLTGPGGDTSATLGPKELFGD